jgi:hypothetical protein
MSEEQERGYLEDNWSFDPENDLPICNNCKHYQSRLNCKAFPPPLRIPDEILNGENNHDKVLTRQTGDFIFQPIEKIS